MIPSRPACMLFGTKHDNSLLRKDKIAPKRRKSLTKRETSNCERPFYELTLALGLPRLTEISVNRGSDSEPTNRNLTMSSELQNSRLGFGSSFPDFGLVQVCDFFFTVNAVKTDILIGKSYKI